MPIYEYKCKSCGHEFEQLVSRQDSPAPPCQKCQGSVDRLISPSAFHLKGAGWYKTGYSKDSTSSSPSSEGGSTSTPKKDES